VRGGTGGRAKTPVGRGGVGGPLTGRGDGLVRSVVDGARVRRRFGLCLSGVAIGMGYVGRCWPRGPRACAGRRTVRGVRPFFHWPYVFAPSGPILIPFAWSFFCVARERCPS
jgi:hypothetical protein